MLRFLAEPASFSSPRSRAAYPLPRHPARTKAAAAFLPFGLPGREPLFFPSPS